MMKYSKIIELIEQAKKGRMFILVDDENRENEGDLIIPASKITPSSINFMAKFGRGLICLTLCQKQADKLNLSLMSPENIFGYSCLHLHQLFCFLGSKVEIFAVVTHLISATSCLCPTHWVRWRSTA